MPPSSHSRRRRSIVDDDQSSNSYADEASTESGDVKNVKKDNSQKRTILLFLAVTCVLMLIVLGIFAATIVYLSQNIDDIDVDFEFDEVCEDIFGKSDNHLAAEKHAMEAYKELNKTKSLLSTKGPYDIPSLLTFNHPDLVLSGDDVGIDQYLPKNIYPYHYDVKLRVQLPVNGNNDFKISGQVRIEFNVTETSNRVYFNARGIDIENAEDWRHRNLQVANGAHSEVRYVEVPVVMEAGKKYHIVLDFVSRFQPGMEGLYLSRYLDTSGQVRYAASTQFEAMNARRLFPCLDEPYYRSSFTFVVEHPPSYDAFSNMPNVSRTLIEGGQFAQTTFAPLPNSPTYILALLIADDYAVRSAKTKDGTEVRLLARKEFINDVTEALNFGVKVLEWFNKKFEINYPFPKLDIAGIYSFSAGAMENYGLTTFREPLLFYNSNYTYSNTYGQVVIAHEFTHQWFGNLVTPEDWSQLFMSEGFAQFFETYAFAAVTDGNQAEYSLQMAKKLLGTLLNDAKPVHPNDCVANSTLELSYYFDAVTYDRAAAVFNMIRGIVGEDIFFTALRSYLSANRNGHAHWRKLAHALQNVIPKDDALSKIDFEAFFKAWLTVPGFPVVNVKKEGKKFTLKASLFLKLSHPLMDSRWPLGQTWPIPIWYRVSSDFDELKFIMMEPGKDLIVEVPNDDDLIYVNSENHGYYIVNYEGDLFDKVLIAVLNDFASSLTDVSVRFQVDACPLFLTGAISSLKYFNSVNSFYKRKTIESQIFYDCVRQFESIVEGTDISIIFYHELVKTLKPNDEPEMQYRISDSRTNFYLEEAQRLKMDQVVEELSCKVNQTLCTAQQNQKFEKYVMDCRPTDQTADCVKLAHHERGATYCEGIKTENKTYYNHLVKLYTNSRNPFEAEKLMSGLICSKDSQILSKLFTLFTTPNDLINKAKRLSYLATLSSEHPALTRKLFIQNINQIVNDFPTSAADFLNIALSAETENDYLEIVQLLHNNRSLVNRYAHVFRDILNKSRTIIEFKQKVLPGVYQYYKKIDEARVRMSEDPERCVHFGVCIKPAV
uniref:Aminopeptidase n=1 Tax=Panagrellus redivivus TaxID=6233 RepID=A0A7E4UXT2_PANRE